MSRCTNCGYYWKEENEDFACCHYSGIDAWSPCEQDDDYYDDSWSPDEQDYDY